MKYQNIINLLKITAEQPSKFKTKKMVRAKNMLNHIGTIMWNAKSNLQRKCLSQVFMITVMIAYL